MYLAFLWHWKMSNLYIRAIFTVNWINKRVVSHFCTVLYMQVFVRKNSTQRKHSIVLNNRWNSPLILWPQFGLGCALPEMPWIIFHDCPWQNYDVHTRTCVCARVCTFSGLKFSDKKETQKKKYCIRSSKIALWKYNYLQKLNL